jgi:hypothetical protein
MMVARGPAARGVAAEARIGNSRRMGIIDGFLFQIRAGLARRKAREE